MEKKSSAKVITAAMIGNALEYYDFNLFIYLAPVVGPLFFPSEDKIASLLVALGTYAVGYFMRPLGAIAFGYVGDIYGRKRALTLSIILMAIPTFLMGLLPTYETIGILAPIILILLRLLQGFCTGGEYNGAGIFTIENVNQKKAGFAGGMITSSSAIGFLMGSMVASLCLLDVMPSWAWRVAFLLGLVVGGVGLYLRSHIPDSYFEKLQNDSKKRLNFPLKEVIRNNTSSILCIMGIAAFSGIMYHISMTYVSVFLTVFQKWAPSEALSVTSFGIISYIMLAPLSGWLSDKLGGKTVMISGAIATLLGVYPFLSLMASENVMAVIAAQFILVVLAAWFQGPMNLFMAKLFSPEVRYSGLAFSYCMGMALFGGTTSMIATFLANWTGDPVTPAYYAMMGALVGMLSVGYASRRSWAEDRAYDARPAIV